MSKKRFKARTLTETFDPTLWSVAVALSIATIYVACLI